MGDRPIGTVRVLLRRRFDPATRQVLEGWGLPGLNPGVPPTVWPTEEGTDQEYAPRSVWGPEEPAYLVLGAMAQVLREASRDSAARGFSPITSPARGLAEDLLRGETLTLDDGTEFQVVMGTVTADYED